MFQKNFIKYNYNLKKQSDGLKDTPEFLSAYAFNVLQYLYEAYEGNVSLYDKSWQRKVFKTPEWGLGNLYRCSGHTLGTEQINEPKG